MVKIFVNGKEVRREDLCKYEIKSEDVKRFLAERLGQKKKAG